MNKKKKEIIFKRFFDKYVSMFCRKEISILTGVIDLNVYPKIGNFVSDFKKKLKRKKIGIYGFIWCRDFEEERFKEHVHIYFATSRISCKLMKELFSKKKHSNYNFIFPKKTFKAAIEYLIKKELFGAQKKRTYSKSHIFSSPKYKTI